MKKLTKIVATIGPSTETREKIEELIHAGANVIRFNLKHNEISWHREKIALVKEIADDMDVAVGTLIDLQGPEIRMINPLGEFEIEVGEEIVMGNLEEGQKGFSLTHPYVIEYIKAGDEFTVDDGRFFFTVLKKHKDYCVITSHSRGLIKTRKTVNFPGADFPLPVLTERDLEAIRELSGSKVDFVALSFVRTASDIEALREVMKKENFEAHIIAKMETRLSIENMDEILDTVDGIMVARGDLGVELPMEQVPYYQKIMIKKCLEKGIPVITATQVLHSMIERPLPTRAEISDIYNAVSDFTSALMLSEETAAGKYPTEAVDRMSKTVVFTENHLPHRDIRQEYNFYIHDAEEIICDTAYNMYLQFHKKGFHFGGFIVFSETGRTARKISRYRPLAPIYVFAPTSKVKNRLTLVYGVTPFQQPEIYKKNQPVKIEDMQYAIGYLEERGLYDAHKFYLLVYGDNWMVEGKTSTIKVLSPSVPQKTMKSR